MARSGPAFSRVGPSRSQLGIDGGAKLGCGPEEIVQRKPTGRFIRSFAESILSEIPLFVSWSNNSMRLKWMAGLFPVALAKFFDWRDALAIDHAVSFFKLYS
jgi:hypothetical protein